MSKTIDERVVSMQFDNKNFERNVATTMSTLDKLKAKLHLPGASKGLDDVSKSAKKCDLSPIEKGVESVRVKFSAMEVMAVTALTNITNSAINAGKRIVSALTIDPVKTGFQEYETQINAIQTILANTQSKGTTLEDVNSALDELNTYADKTIYNFTEMTRNIGTFTAAGIDLETSVNAIQGIANLAAVSGSTSQQASTAMYQLSQALASGTVKLMDWNSVVNAGMGGQVFQDALKKTSEMLGTGAEAAIKAEGSFRESLTTGWLTAEVLTETLKGFTTSGANEYVAEYTGLSKEAVQAALDEAKAKYGEANAIKEASKALAAKSGKNAKEIEDALSLARTSEDAATKVKTFTQLMDTLKESAQSGWTQTWELILGDFEQAKEFFTKLSDTFGKIINAMSETRNAILGGALNSKWDSFSEKLEKAGVSVEDFESKLKETAKDQGIAVDELIEKHGSLVGAIKAGKIPASTIIDTLKKLAGTESKTAETTEDMTEKLKYFQEVVDKVWHGDYDAGVERVKKLEEAGYNYQEVQDLVNKTVDGHRLTLEDLSDTQLKSIGYTEDQIKAIRELAEEAEKSGTPLNELIHNLSKPSGRELLLESLSNILTSIGNVAKAIKAAWQDIFPPKSIEEKSAALYRFLEAMYNFTSELVQVTRDSTNLKRTLRGLFAIIDIIRTVVGGAFRIALKVLCAILNATDLSILDITAAVGDAIVAFRDWLFGNDLLVRGIEWLIDVIKKAYVAIRDWIKAFLELPAVKKTTDKLKSAFGDTFKKLKEHFSGGGEVIRSFIKRVSEMDGFSFKNIKLAVEDFVKNVLGYFFDMGGCFTGLKNALKDMKDRIGEYLSATIEGFDNFKNKVVSAFNWIKEKISSINFGGVLAVGILVGLALFVKKITDILQIFANGVEGFGGFLESFIDIGKSIKNVFNSLALQLKSKALLNAALAIGVLAAAVAVLAFIPVGNLIKAGVALLIISGILIGLTVALGYLGKNVKDFGKVTSVLLALGGAVLLLTISAKMLAGMSDDEIKTAESAIVALSAVVIALIAVSKLSGKHADKAGKMVRKIATALLVMVLVMKIAGGMDYSELKNGLTAIMMLELLVVALIAVSKLAGEHAKSAGKMIFKISLALLVMVGVMKIASTMDTLAFKKGLTVIATLEALVIALIAVSRLAGANATKAGAMILQISFALLIMVGVLRLVAWMDAADVQKGLKAIAALELLIIALIAVSRLAGKNSVKAGLMILEISGALLLLVAAIAIMSFLDPAGIDKAVDAITQIMGVFIVMIAASALAKKDVAGTIKALTIAISAIAIAVAALTLIDPSKLRTAVAGMGVVMLTFAVLIASLHLINTNKGVFLRTAGTLVLITGIIVIIGEVLKRLDDIKPSGALGAASAISIALLAIAAAIEILDDAKFKDLDGLAISLGTLLLVVAGIGVVLYALQGLDPSQSLGMVSALSVALLAIAAALEIIDDIKVKDLDGMMMALGTLTLVVAALGIILIAVKDLDPVQSIGMATALSELLLAISGAAAIISMIKPVAAGGIKSILPVLGVIAAIAAALVTVSAIVYELGGADSVAGSVSVLTDIGTAIGGFIGGIVGGAIGGLASGITSALPQIGKDLSDFMTNLQPFLAGASSVDSSVLTSSKNIASVILYLSAAELMDSLTSWLTGGSSMTGFAEQLVPFGRAMVAFSNTVAGKIDADAVDAAANAGKMMAEMADTLPNSGGVLGFIMGENDMQEFGNQLVPFGRAMTQFSSIVAGKIDEDAVLSAANAGKMMAEMATTLPNSGGVLGFIMGENDMQEFGNQLVPFGRAMVMFSNAVAGKIDESGVECAANAGKMMAAMAADIPNSGGVLGFIMGENDMQDFGNQLVPFGTAMVAFSRIVSGNIEIGGVEAAATAGQIMAAMANELPSYGGVLGFIMGDQITMEEFGNQLVPFGKAMVAFSSAVNGKIDQGGVQAAANAGNIMIALSTELPTSGGLLSWIVGDQVTMSEFGEELVGFGKAMVSFSDSVKGGVDHAAMTGVVEAASDTLSLALALPDEMDFSSLKDGLEDLSSAMVTFASSIDGKVDVVKMQGTVEVGRLLGEMASTMPDEIDLSKITNGITSFGKGMVAYSNTVSGKVNTTDMRNVASAGLMIAEMMAAVPTTKVDMTSFAIDIANFGIGIASFSDKVTGSIDLLSIGNACKAGVKLAELVQLIPSSIDYIGFNLAIGGLGTAIVTFSKNVQSGLDLVAIDNAVAAGEKLTGMASTIPAYVEFSSFNTGIVGLGASIKAFSNMSAAGINIESVNTAVSAGNQIAGLTKNIPQYVDFASFNTGITGLGTAILRFSTSVSANGGLSYEAITTACTAGKKIAAMTSVIPQYVDFASFNTGIVGLGNSIKAFSSTVENSVNSGAVTAAANAGKEIAAMTSVIPQYVDFVSFNSGIVALGGAIKSFSSTVENSVNSGGIDSACIAGRKIAGLTAEIPKSVDFAAFNSGIVKLADSVVKFSSTVQNGVDLESVSKVRSVGNNIMEMADDFKLANFSEFNGCISSVGYVVVEFSKKMKTIGTAELNEITGAFETMVERFNKVGDEGIDEFIDAFSNRGKDIKAAVAKLPATASDAIDNQKEGMYSDFYSAGKYCVQGFSNGMGAYTYLATNAGTALGKAALEAAKEALREASPSKAFYEVGAYGGEGFVNAFYDYERISYKAGESMANTATRGLSRAISKVSDIVDLDIDTQPTIRPVLDLSEISSGADRINGMLSMRPSVDVLTNVGTIGAMMNGRTIVTNYDVVSAIKDLGRNMGNTSGDTYNINGITYDDGSNVQGAVKALVRAARVERRR